MNLESISAHAALAATIVPVDALASGSYRVGLAPKNHDFSAVSQLYSLKVNNLTAPATLDLDSGTLTGGGAAAVNGGTGEDPDGQPVDLNFIHAFQIRNTSLTEELVAEITSWTGGTAPFSDLTIPAQGEALFILPAGQPLTAGLLTLTPDTTGAFELIVLGKN